ncbi:carbonic anhydrase [Gammaproteobacteria bacterium]
MTCSHNFSRRNFLTTTAMGSVALLLSGFEKAFATDSAPKVTADEAMKLLKEGNARFTSGKTTRPHITKERLQETYKQGQHPFATIIACSDSRVPVEEIFDQGVGDIFTIRVAGNVVHADESGSVEYGAGHLGTGLVVVMGHTKCGAVTAVVKGDKLGGNIPKLVDTIAPAVARSKAKKPELTGDALINDSIIENVKESMSLLLKSEEIAHLVHEGKVKVVGALYHIESGIVDWL